MDTAFELELLIPSWQIIACPVLRVLGERKFRGPFGNECIPGPEWPRKEDFLSVEPEIPRLLFIYFL